MGRAPIRVGQERGRATRRWEYWRLARLALSALLTAFALSSVGVAIAAASTANTLLAYGSIWSYKQTAHGGLEGFQAPSFTPDATWVQGTAPFGGGSGYYCGSEYEHDKTNWESNTDLLLRHSLMVPPFAYDVLVHLEVDNDADVFWDGQDISHGIQEHNECATSDDVGPFEVPGTLLSATASHLLAVRAVDTGLLTLFDSSVTYQVAEPFGAAGIVQAPPPKTCVSRRAFTIHIRQLPGLTYRRLTVSLNRHRIAVHAGQHVTAPVNLKGLPRGTYVVKITVLTTSGLTVTGARTYHACRAHPLHPRGQPKLSFVSADEPQ